MDYISLLTDKELTRLCQIISGRAFKILFQQCPRDFSKIKSGFRPSSISDEEAVALASRYADELFISSFITSHVKDWLKEVKDNEKKQMSKGMDPDHALAEALYDSVFADDIELYFKLENGKTESTYLEKIKVLTSDMIGKDYTDFNKNGSENNLPSSNEIKKLRKLLNESQQQLKELTTFYEGQLQRVRDSQRDTEQSLAITRQKLQVLQQQQKVDKAELSDFRERKQSDNTTNITMSMYSTEFEHVSVCEVAPLDYNGKRNVTRLADVVRNGVLEAFYLDDERPKSFDNRSKIYYTDGPLDINAVGVWNWSAQPKKTDPTKDYVTSAFNPYIEPIEIIIIHECNTATELLDKLKSGIDVEFATTRIMFAVYLVKSEFVGFLCSNKDFVQNGSQIKLSQNVMKLPRYQFGSRDIIYLPNNKAYYRTINIDVPSEVVSVKDPLDIVRTIIQSRSTWQVFKQRGKTRSEWKSILELLHEMDTVPIISQISDAADCSAVEAQKMLDDFVEYASSYIDGNTIEDEIISAVIAANDELMERCKSLILDDWVAENEEAVEEANSELENLHNKIEDAKVELNNEYLDSQERLEKQKAIAEKELTDIKTEYDALKLELQGLTEDVMAKQKFAADVEAAVAKRIQQAQNDAADFVASLAFLPKIDDEKTRAIDVDAPILSATPILASEVAGYTPGIELEPDDIDEYSTWVEVLNIIADELIDAGVTSSYARPLAAYMYASYLHRCPLLMVGPNSNAIVDAFSCAIFGKNAGSLNCTEEFRQTSIDECYHSQDVVIRIVNPFSNSWITRLPDIISKNDKFFVAVYPYMEDIQIEPKTLFSYMLPIFTEIFVDHAPNEMILGGKLTKNYKEFPIDKATKKNLKVLTQLRTSPLVRNRIQTLSADMHSMLGDQNTDFDVAFIILPYAIATMQIEVLLKAVADGDSKKISISKELQNLIVGMFGECE